MRVFVIALSLSIVLLSAAFTNWSVISLLFLVSFLVFQYELKGQVQSGKPWQSLWMSLGVSLLGTICGVTVALLQATVGRDWRFWKSSISKVFGVSRLDHSDGILLFFLPKMLVGVVSLYGLRWRRRIEFGPREFDAFEVRAFLRNFVLPTLQIVAGSIFPCWAALPYFVCSCTGLFHWSMTGNFFGLSWGWQPLLVYNTMHIIIFYVRQLPISFPTRLLHIVDYLGLFETSSAEMTWAKGVHLISILTLFVLLCFAIGDLKDLYHVKQALIANEDNLYQGLLNSPRSARSRQWWISEQQRFLVFKKVAMYFFACGFPICLFALVCWSFKFASFCAFFLLLYVGIILYIFPSLFLLRRLNGLLLGFILTWASCTYIFNAGFTVFATRFEMDVDIWQTVGLWKYSSPGLFLLAQYALGVLVATDLFVGNSILKSANEVEGIAEDDTFREDELRKKWILFIAVIAWCLRRSTHVISLVLIFIVALRSGFVHAVYMIFFMVYLLSSSVARKTRQYLMLYCELHISILYILQLQSISALITAHSKILKPVLSQLGIWNKATYHDYIPVAALLCFSAVQNHGIKVISSLSAVARQSALKYRPYVLSVYGSKSFAYNFEPSSTENWITNHLATVGEHFRATYRSFGTYIVYATVLITVYAAEPNYIAFGFLALLLFWIIGRQVLGKTEWILWSPLFLYTCLVFVLRYLLSVFPDLQPFAEKLVDLKGDLGFDGNASLFLHVWDSLAILAVLQLYRFERSQSCLEEDSIHFPCFMSNLDFVKRLLILHSGKVLFVAVFYASIFPVGGFGFVYLIMLVISCAVPKSSPLSSQLFAAYTGLLLFLEYLFQLVDRQDGCLAQNADLIHWLGLRKYEEGPWGIEAGSRSKTLVILACMLQYCSFQWLEQVPSSLRRNEEPCMLFSLPFSGRADSDDRRQATFHRVQPHSPRLDEPLIRKPEQAINAEAPDSKKYVHRSPSLTPKESRKWSRRALIMKQETYEAQCQALKMWGQFILENFFTIFGVEMIMLCLLVAAFAVVNVFSLLYILILALCIILSKKWLRPLWPAFTVLFAGVLLYEYATLAKLPPPWSVSNESTKRCHDCWADLKGKSKFCWSCWLGMVDDRQVLVAYFMVFIVTSFQLRANKLLETVSLQWTGISATHRVAWAEMSYETTVHWTWLDYLRFFFYRHLLHAVLLLVFITGTLQYDLLHLGYLAFSMVFFHMRTTVMRRRNTIFLFLRLYNFSLIVASLVFQAPFFGFVAGCSPSSIFGLYKYDYGFKITARSALVDITIFCLVSLQSRVFRTKEFEQVLRYLAAEQFEALACAHERKAEWKKEQLQRVREIEEKKSQRRLQVDKMKMEMVPLQLRLDVLNSASKFREAFSPSNIPRFLPNKDAAASGTPSRLVNSISDSALLDHSGHRRDSGADSCRRRRKLFLEQDDNEIKPEVLDRGIILQNLDKEDSMVKTPSMKHSLLSGVSFLENGVAQMHDIGNKALANLVGLLNIENPDSDEAGSSSADEGDDQRRLPKHISPGKLEDQKSPMFETRQRLSILSTYVYSLVLANTDVVCYVLFVLVYVWNFSLLTLVYPACLFLYALLVNPGPTQLFWSAMLMYTEILILLQYMYQTLVNHCGHDELPSWLKQIGIPGRNMNRSFVASVLPLFLVYLATLVQNSIKDREGEWMLATDSNSFFTSRRSPDLENPNQNFSAGKFWTWIAGYCIGSLKTVLKCWRSLTSGSEVPPHFVQVKLSVSKWSEHGIQPERIETAFNRLLIVVRYESSSSSGAVLEDASRVRVESLECGTDESTAFAMLEVIHAAPALGGPVSDLFTSLTPASDVATEIVKAKQDGLLEQANFPYPILSVIAGGRRQVDLYAYVFGTDLIAFMYMALFYQSFIKSTPEFLDVYQLEDQFPKEYVFALITLFFLIVLDRVLYLSAFATGKVIYYFATLIFFTGYITNFVWGMELKHNNTGTFFQLLPLRGFFLLKALSLAFQAQQLRFGLPHKNTLYEQFLTRKINSLSWLGFRIYRSLPFLFELRCVLDWSCTTTSLSMYDWLKLEDIYASLFLVQCDNKLAREKHQLGQKRSIWVKFTNGVCLFLLLICVIWAPMLIYSSGNPTNFVNEITEAHFEISLRTAGGSFTFYRSQLCNLHSMADILDSGYDIDVDNALDSFDSKDVQMVCCEEDADSLWLIPPPTLRNLVKSFTEGVLLVPSWNFHRERPKSKETATFTGLPLAIKQLQEVLNGTLSSILVADLYPRYFRVTSGGEARLLEQTSATVSGNLTLNRETQAWWSFNVSSSGVCGDVTGPMAIAVSEEVPKGLIGDTLSKFNIWSLYITFVLAVGRFIRLQCADLRMRIPYENFPSCDRLIAICEDIYAARAERELALEEGLFWTLVKIYRSPHILLEYTKTE
ncbi:piezo-type mechanosensitive ion channel homolog isoform X3 [Selaginella moellendorffii]|uniref:piezo-type mechanosensitive ion channel homolog isoform X3 n=1 Tax=Selaginella moellendorffii TaxID=88036 RepID=UPI000D1C4999|nr:piezo-type mechanosensitive ion channel homolog isoform X3 [Selaginella moellendorffii]|eukprot:XP_024535480.1 piezo-type mechanosensitive ion channel homolog isoform X3 [Selaginella moellendorffii]